MYINHWMDQVLRDLDFSIRIGLRQSLARIVQTRERINIAKLECGHRVVGTAVICGPTYRKK